MSMREENEVINITISYISYVIARIQAKLGDEAISYEKILLRLHYNEHP